MMKRLIVLAALFVLVPALAAAEDHGDHLAFEVVSTGLSSATFQSDALLETITGTTVSVHGTIHTILAQPGHTRADLRVDAASMRTGNDLRDEHLRSGDWLNTEEHPHIVFELTEVTVPEGATLTHGQAVQAHASGRLTIRGTTNDIRIPVSVTYFEVEGTDIGETFGVESNLLRLSSDFTVQLSDYGISIARPLQTKLSNDIQLNMRVTAAQQ